VFLCDSFKGNINDCVKFCLTLNRIIIIFILFTIGQLNCVYDELFYETSFAIIMWIVVIVYAYNKTAIHNIKKYFLRV